MANDQRIKFVASPEILATLDDLASDMPKSKYKRLRHLLALEPVLRSTMDEALLREISEQYLLPFFSGATILPSAAPSSASESQVAFINPQTIRFKVNRLDNYRLEIRRDQPFAQTNDPARETRVIEAFVGILEGMSDELDGPLKQDLLSTFARRVVARAVAEKGEDRNLLAIIDQLALWATRLYEGAPIASAFGIDTQAKGLTDLRLDDVAANDFGAVLSNGLDTLLVFDRELGFVGHNILPPPPTDVPACPRRYASIAHWTAGASGADRIAVALNRLGEILVFRSGQLLFARRSGTWNFLTHGPVLGQMVVPKRGEIRSAIYETALDASFARTGACLGVVSSNVGRNWERVIAQADRLELKISPKSKALAQVIEGKRFHEIDRTLRQEIVAIDGATVINHEGKVLAAGAILQIDGGSTGGGRTAAAKALAKLGLGIKVSQDGGITAYRPETNDSNEVRVAFKVM